MTKILYVSGYTNVTAKRANVTNVLYMSDSFRKYAKSYTIAFVPLLQLFSINKIIKNIDADLDVRVLPVPYVKCRGIYLLFDIISLFYACFFLFLGYRVYTRNCRFAEYFYKISQDIYIELHDFSAKSQHCLNTCGLATFFPISDGLAADAKKKFPGRRLVLLPDAAKLAKEGEINLCTKGPVIMYIGSENDGKGVDFIVKLARECAEYDFVLVGPQKRTKPRKNLTYFGYANKSQISSLMQAADVLIAPYSTKVYDNAGNDITDYMSPLKIFEYMSSKTPFVCSDMPFLRSFLQNDIHCLMAKAEDIDDWKCMLDRLIFDADKKIMLATNAYDLYIRNYTWDKRAVKVYGAIK